MVRKGRSKQRVDRGETQPEAKLGRKEYEREPARLQGELVAISQIAYEPQKPRDGTLPERQKARGYREPDFPLRYIPTPF